MGSTTITVRSNRPRLEEGRRHLIDSSAGQPKQGEYLIKFECEESNVTLYLGHIGDYVTIHDLDSVTIRETVQVAS